MLNSMERQSKNPASPEGMRTGRRGLIRMMLGSVGLAVMTKKIVSMMQPDERVVQSTASHVHTDESVTPSEEATPEESTAAEVILSRSHWFTKVVEEVEVVMARDVDLVLERKTALDDIIKKHFSVAKISSEKVRQNIEALIVGVVFTESRFDKMAGNGDAFGPFQLTDGVWTELAKHGEDKDSMADQAKIAGKLFEQSYRHITQTCSEELQKICTVFFGGDEELFEHQFLTPVIVEANTLGMGDMAQVIAWFTTEYVPELDTKKIIEVLDGKVCPTGYDVFYLMSHLAYSKHLELQKQGKQHGEHLGWTKHYGDKSRLYAPRVYAGYGLITEAEAKRS
jgi:hypothetical protein